MTLTRPLIATLAMAFLVACSAAPDKGRDSERPSTSPGQDQAPAKHIVAAVMADPPALHRAMIAPGHLGQSGDLTDLVNGGLTALDHQNVRRPTLAEAVPTAENGLWVVHADGTMETTWRIREGATWHDGTPVSTRDLVFAATVGQDPGLPELRSSGFDMVSAVEPVDARTIRVRWKAPYIWADRMFGSGGDAFAMPLPAQLLEESYKESRESFRQLPYWSQEYVGAGPYRVREWAASSHVYLDAFDTYVLGRPKISRIEVRFIPDPNTLTANLLSGAVDLTLGSSLALDQSVEVRDQWRDGRMELTFASWIVVYPQFINPDPPVVADLRFRRAMLHAIDRQTMADTIQAGLVPVAHSYITPSDPEYGETEQSVVRYDYDTRRALQLLEELGYRQGTDGQLRDAQAKPLAMEVRTTASPAIHTRTFFPMIDYWQRLGIGIDAVVIPVQRLRDLEYRTQQPTFEMVRYPNSAANVWRLHSSQTPLPESKFTGHNRSRYVNPDFDAMIDRYLAAIPWTERMQALGQIVHHISDQLNVMGLFYDTKTTLVSNRLAPVHAQSTGFNALEWDLK